MRHRLRSELQLIRLVQRTVRPRDKVVVGIGDDACVLKNGLVVTTDAYAQGVHFDLRYMNLRQVGARCTCAALADIAAMSAQPEVVLVALTLTRNATTAQVQALYRGIEDVCQTCDCEVAGGDTIVADRLSVTVTVVGRSDHPRLRTSARPGERVYVTGTLGAAEAGRIALQRRLPRRRYSRLIGRHLLPLPRFAVAQRLSPLIAAMIDTSDGLAADARHIAQQSGVRIAIKIESIPVDPTTSGLCRDVGVDPLRFVLTAGEDHELLFTSADAVPESSEGVPITEIGQVEHGTGVYTETKGKRKRLELKGFDHFGPG